MARSKVLYDKDQIIDKAFHIVNEGELSIRKLSKELGVSSMTLYNYVENIDDIKKEVAIKGFNILYRQIYTTLNTCTELKGGGNLILSCEIIVQEMYDFAVQYPGVYLLIYGPDKALLKKDVEVRPFYKLFNQLFRRMKISLEKEEAYRKTFVLLEYIMHGMLMNTLIEKQTVNKEEYMEDIKYYLTHMIKE